jgi:hypothetical protein
MNDSTRFSDDEAMLARLRSIAQEVDPVPEHFYELGHEVFSLQRIDDELAELVADSRVDAQAVRATVTAAIRMLSFHCRVMTIEIQVTREGGVTSVLGQLMRDVPQDGRADLESTGGALSSAPIEAGDRFEFSEVPATMVRFRIETPGSAAVTTTWVEL